MTREEIWDYDEDIIFWDDCDEALEWIEFNIRGAWVGERTPIILHKVLP